MGVCVGARKNARRFFLALLIAVACMVVVFPGCRSTGDPFADLVIKEYKTGRYDEIEVAPGFILHSNMWGTEEATDQKICLYEDGSYGWEWKRGDSGEDKYNYPEIFYGIKPWGQGVDDDELLLPKQLHEINSLLVELDFDYRITNSTGTWYVTLEFFLTKEKPTIGDKKDEEVRKAVTDEVMIFFDWYDSLHSPQVSGAIADGSYTYDLFREEKWPDWFYFDFRIGKKGKIPEKIDLSLFLDYIKDARGEISDLWLGAVEFGIMYSDRTAGRALVKKFDLVINGDRVSSGRQ